MIPTQNQQNTVIENKNTHSHSDSMSSIDFEDFNGGGELLHVKSTRGRKPENLRDYLTNGQLECQQRRAEVLELEKIEEENKD